LALVALGRQATALNIDATLCGEWNVIAGESPPVTPEVRADPRNQPIAFSDVVHYDYSDPS